MAQCTLICPEGCRFDLGQNYLSAGSMAGRIALAHSRKNGHEGGFLLSLSQEGSSVRMRGVPVFEAWELSVTKGGIDELARYVPQEEFEEMIAILTPER